MKTFSRREFQTGAVTIFVCMVMLLLMTVLTLTAYSLSDMNLRMVHNVQVREEATAAANEVIERIASLDFTANPGGFATAPYNLNTPYTVNINGDGNAADYSVALMTPICVRAVSIAVTSSSSVTLPGMTTTSAWNTVWELDATATEPTTGACVRVRHGVRVLLSNTEKAARCVPPVVELPPPC